MKFKNPLGAPESILLRGLHIKFDPIRPRGLGCRGAIDFGPTTSYNLGTSVEQFFWFGRQEQTHQSGNLSVPPFQQSASQNIAHPQSDRSVTLKSMILSAQRLVNVSGFYLRSERG